jgi:hypothetical protein
MNSLMFWKGWHREYRIFGFLLFFVFLFSVGFLWYSYFRGEDNVISWQRLQEQKQIETTVHSFQLGPFNLDVPGETYIIFEYLNGGALIPNTIASYLYLILLVFSAVVLLTIVTSTQRFWFYAGMALFMLFVISFRFETLGLCDSYSQIPTAVIIGIYVLISFYFNKLRSQTSFVIRCAVFTVVTALIAVIFSFFSTVDFPFYQLTVTGLGASIVLSIIFIWSISHEVIRGFVYIINNGTSKNLNHLLIISTIYLVNVIITCLHQTGYLHWDFVYINIFLILTISAGLGLWGFLHREELYSNLFSFYPIGAFYYLAMGTICFITTGQLLGNANDQGWTILEDLIIFGHAGFGLAFLMYLFSNFSPMLAKNMPIYNVLYRPKRMPYFTFRFAGLIITLAFVFTNNVDDYINKGVAAYYNSGADLQLLQGDPERAENFYNRADFLAYRNHRSNYSLAKLRTSESQYAAALDNYAAANDSRPSEYSLVNEGNLLAWQSKYVNAIREYKDGLTKNEESGAIVSNLALSYIRIKNTDSALYYLRLAREEELTKNAAETNFFALAAQQKSRVKIDSIIALFDTDAPGTLSNALAAATITNTAFDIKVDPLSNRQLDLYSATLLNNYVVKNAKTLDTTFLEKASRIASDSINRNFSEALKSSLALGYYHQGNISRALGILAEQVFLSQDYQGKFNYIMGLWALEQKHPQIAAEYFQYASRFDFPDAPFYRAIAITEGGDIQTALAAWDTVTNIGSSEQKLIAQSIRRILTLPVAHAVELSDGEKYQFCRYRIGLGDSVVFNRVVNTFANADYKAQALLDLSGKYLEAGRIQSAIHYYNRIAGLQLSNARLYEDFRHYELLLLSTRRELRLLAQQINNGIEFGPHRRLERIYYTALITESNGDTENARKLYKILGSYNPFFEEGIISAADFFRKDNTDRFAAYNILSEAIHVNTKSIRLWKAYYEEALRVGFDEYAANAAETIQELERGL